MRLVVDIPERDGAGQRVLLAPAAPTRSRLQGGIE